MNLTTTDKTSTSLQEAVRHEVERESLTTDQLGELMSLQRDVLAAEDHGSRRSRIALLVSCALLLVGLALLWPRAAIETVDYSQAIALEVVENHLKLKPLDVDTRSMDEIRDFFTQLNFLPATSRLAQGRFGLAQNAMLGGRYCSIKGVTAAQLRYQEQGSGLSTLYQVAYDPHTFGDVPRLDRGETPKELEARGLTVSMWVEKGLLMVLVKEQ
jgi:hypothetical protein